MQLHRPILILALCALVLQLLIVSCQARDEQRRNRDEVAVQELPREARETLKLIKQGGPFPYKRDGVVFGNFERRLPAKQRGYYREYTVATPGLRHRGARRIVAGSGGEFYYTHDHYESFRRIIE